MFVALLALACATSLLASPANAEDQDTARYIVVFEDSVAGPANLAKTQTENRDAKLGFVYRHAAKGYSAELTRQEVEGLRDDSRVKFVTRDHLLRIFAQSTPTGIERIFATQNTFLSIDEVDDVRVDANVAVIDTGIAEHEDLNIAGYTDCQTKVTECKDGVGGTSGAHGTHVAGTIGALDNGKGAVGVAPGARLWAVRIELAGSLSAFESSAMAGVDWVAATRQDENPENDIEVANMSFGCYEFAPIAPCSKGTPGLDSAISNAVEEGVVMVAAAGNETDNASFVHPASHPDVITVSALADYDGKPGGATSPTCNSYGSDDTLATFSNYGATIEVAAPGVCIYSTWTGGGYGTSSGTSMASPHVAGAAAILASQDKPETKADVEAIRATIIKEGNTDSKEKGGWDDTSGDGVKEPLLDVGNEAIFGNIGWTIQPTPNPSSTAKLYDVSCASASECIAVGSNGTPSLAQRWNGSEWSTMTSPGEGGALTDVSCATTTSCVALPGSGLNAQRWNGSTWTIVAAATPAEATSPVLRGVSCTSSTSCIAVGTYSLAGGKTRTLAESWNGEKWTILTTPFEEGGTNALNAVSCTSSSSCTAIGTKGGKALALRYNGSEWTSLAAPQEASSTSADISCTATNACTALIGANAKAERWNGSKWTSATLPTPEGGSTPQLYGVSCASETDCIAVGHYTSASGVRTLAERWNGSAWSAQATPNPAGQLYGSFRGLSCVTPSECTGVGFYEPVKAQSQTLAERYVALVPTATTEAATGVTAKATLNATVNPAGRETTYQFEYGTTTSYGSKVPVSPKAIGSGTADVKVSQTIEGLKAHTTYHFRVVASNAAGTTYGTDKAFTTPSVTFVKNGVTMKKGSEIHGVVGSATVETAYGPLNCPFEFSGELSAGDPATVKMFTVPVFNCTGSESNPIHFEFINFKATPIEFFADETAKYQLSFEVNTYYFGKSSCTGGTASSADVTWENNTFPTLVFLNRLISSGLGWCPEIVMSGYFLLTTEGQPFEIVVK